MKGISLRAGDGVAEVREDDGVVISTIKLKDILLSNRASHRAVFEEALEGYREAVVKELEEALVEAKKGQRRAFHSILVQPMDQTKEYDRVIKMLELSVDVQQFLTPVEFAQYVMDDWSWKQQFTASTVNYTKSGTLR